jgi:hypothetical protein
MKYIASRRSFTIFLIGSSVVEAVGWLEILIQVHLLLSMTITCEQGAAGPSDAAPDVRYEPAQIKQLVSRTPLGGYSAIRKVVGAWLSEIPISSNTRSV